jgi:hypothetical protein
MTDELGMEVEVGHNLIATTVALRCYVVVAKMFCRMV